MKRKPLLPAPSDSAFLRPGSNEAIDAGYLNLGKVWVMTLNCPLHGDIAAAPPSDQAH